ncbi:aspartyl protease [Rhizoctonia solani 123E]|uniref:Aspartyl protease n=1 Tax=Rhizoctonia solani 123E TaxID=1423351 RepID=A0A074S9Y5_9AGAM|nr:aspartyl protease [Rhizoctonia solani 123E]
MKYHAGLVLSLLSTLATAKPPSEIRVGRNASELKPLDIPIKITTGYHTIQLQLGTPPQPVDLLFDTGSGPLWVLNPECATNCPSSYKSRSFFDPHASNTAQSANLRETVNYLGTSVVSGEVWSDKVTIQNITFPTPQRLINADRSDDAFLPAGGILGLGFRSLALGNTSIHDALFHSMHLPDHRIGIYLGNVKHTDLHPSPQTNGIVTFGGSHEDKYGAEPLKWINVLPAYSGQYTYWHVPINGVKTSRHTSTGPNEANFPSQTGGAAIFDTGSQQISVPRSIIADLSSALGYNYTAVSMGYRPLCSEVATYNASLTLTFGDVEITVTSNDLSKPGYTADEYCWPPFEPWDSPNWLIGKRFLCSFYSVWDLGGWNVSKAGDGQPRTGLSYLKEGYQPHLM